MAGSLLRIGSDALTQTGSGKCAGPCGSILKQTAGLFTFRFSDITFLPVDPFVMFLTTQKGGQIQASLAILLQCLCIN